MDETKAIDRRALAQGCRALLRPLASLILKCGMTWREFAEISRTVFVEVASREYGIRGRPTNISRVAILTGIGRRDVGRIRRALEEEGPPLPNQTTDATRVLSGWHQDTAFMTTAGGPAELPVSGSMASFEELSRRYAPDVPPSAMLKELMRVQAVQQRPDGRLRVMRRHYQPMTLDPQWLLNAGSVMADLGANINHNLGVTGQQSSWFLGRATDNAVDAGAVLEFRAFLEEEGQRFLERVDDWLARHRQITGRMDKKDPPEKVRLGAGLFMIKGNPDKELER